VNFICLHNFVICLFVTSEICSSEKPTRYHGDLWNVTECEFCTCKHGKVQCFNAVCEPAICSEVCSAIKNLIIYLYEYLFLYCLLRVMDMVFNTTFSNISVKSWQSVLLMEETEVPVENHWPAANHWQTFITSTPRHEQDSNSQL
jgi:hypothetical protein